jgi:hypothetical protein
MPHSHNPQGQALRALRDKLPTLRMPIERALPVSMNEPFYSAFVRAIALN